MALILNLRGTNGSGKSTLARSFLPPSLDGSLGLGGPVDLTEYDAPTKRDPGAKKMVGGYFSSQHNAVVVGKYATATGGMDGIPSFDLAFKAIRRAVEIAHECFQPAAKVPPVVIAEGILASTVYGSWGEFAKQIADGNGSPFAFVYLSTPEEVCLERIKQRQAASGREPRDINVQLVRDKFKSIAATRAKAIAGGHVVYDLPWDNPEWTPEQALHAIAIGQSEELFRAHT